MPRRALCSLHDVTPFHLPRLERAEALFADLGVAHVTYLLIPDYHGLGRADTDAFRAWCRRDRPFRVDWMLHGYYHLETSGPPAGDEAPAGGGEALAGSSALGTHLKRRYATAGEGEFLALPDEEARQRIRRGKIVFQNVMGHEPDGFVPPAWLHTPSLPGVVHAAGLRLWEDRKGIADLPAGVSLPAPVITWATRTPFRKWTSILGTPALAALAQRAPVLRLAVHPFDFDHPETVASIRRVWGSVLRSREAVGYDEALAEARAAVAP